MRRVLIRLGAVVVVPIGLIIALPFIQARRLSKQLRADVAALRAREIQRVATRGAPESHFCAVKSLRCRA